MALFVVRVELRGTPTREDYDRLHAAMRKASFSQTIAGSTGTFNLPHATYSSTFYATCKQAADAANGAASQVWKDHCLIASGSDWNSWNLQKVP